MMMMMIGYRYSDDVVSSGRWDRSSVARVGGGVGIKDRRYFLHPSATLGLVVGGNSDPIHCRVVSHKSSCFSTPCSSKPINVPRKCSPLYVVGYAISIVVIARVCSRMVGASLQFVLLLVLDRVCD